jgi:hypothetical protein
MTGALPIMQLPTIPSAPIRMTRRTPLSVDFCPGKYSVLCGRGKICSTSSGNRRLNNMVKHFVKPYSEAKTKFEKSNIVSAIIATIRQACPPGGGFVKFEEGEWWEVDDSFAREKIGCLFRDCLHSQYRSSNRAKLSRRKAKPSKEPSNGSPAMTGMPKFPAPLCPNARQVSHKDSYRPTRPDFLRECLAPMVMSTSSAQHHKNNITMTRSALDSCSPPVMSIEIPVARSLIQDDLFSEVQSYRPTPRPDFVGDCLSPMVMGSSAQLHKNNATMIWSALNEPCEIFRDYVDDDDMMSMGSPDDISEIGEASDFLDVVFS